MTAPPSQCPNPECGCPVQPADPFCDHCGWALGAAANNAPAATSSVADELANVRADLPKSLRSELRPGSSAMAGEVKPPPNNLLAGDVSGPPAGAASPSDCPDLEVRYNNSCVFVLNMQSTFDFEIRPLTDGVRELSVEVRQSGQKIASERPRVLPRRDARLAFGLNYTPRNTHAGKVSFEILVSYRQDQERRIYAAYRTHTIYSGKEDPRQVCESLVVEVKNNIQQGHAGDLRVDQRFDGLPEALRDCNTIALDREFLQLINARPFWTQLPLAECAEETTGGTAFLRRARPLQRVMLRSADGAGIQVLTQPSLRIGRARDCEIVARVRGPSGQQLVAESLRIGRYHACMEWKGNECQILDRGYYADEKRWRPSSTGLWIDGKRVPAGGEFIFAPGREYRITLAEPTGDTPAAFELAARLWLVRDLPLLRPGCPDFRAATASPACVVLRRMQGPAESYVLLRSAASLAWADPRADASCVCLRENALHFSDGHGCDRLVPGRPIRAGALTFQVLDTQTT